MTTTSDTMYQVIVSNDVDEDGDFKAEVLVNAKTSKVFFSKDREVLIGKARQWVAWHRNHDESVEMIDL